MRLLRSVFTRLSAKLLLLFLLLAIVPLAVVGYLAYENGRQTIERMTLSHLDSTSRLREAAFGRWVQYNETVLTKLGENPSVGKYALVLVSEDQDSAGYEAAHDALLRDHLAPALEGGLFLELAIIRAQDGLILCSSDEGLEGKYRESEPYFVEGKVRTYVGKVTYSPSEGMVMHISVPIHDVLGDGFAVLAANANLAEMNEIIGAATEVSGREDTYLVNASRFFVTDPRFGEGFALKKAIYTEGAEACLEQGDGMGLYDDYRGVPVLGTYRWLPERELCILTELDQAEAFAPILGLRNATIAAGAAMALCAASLGVIFTRTITGPVHQLVKATEEIGAGNLDYRIKAPGKDEIGQLAAAFNDMTGKRQQAETELRKHREHLEQLVEERAAELKRTNEELEAEIAEHRRAEEALRESEERFRHIYENALIGLYRTTPDGRILMANPALVRMLGYSSSEELAQRNLEESGYEPDYPRSAFKEAIEAEGQVRGLESAWKRHDGTTMFLRESARAVRDGAGNTLCYEGSVEDITARRQAEDRLNKTMADLERSNKELEQFAYVASHDLQEPLRMVSSYTQLLARRYQDQLDQDAQEFIGYAVDGAERMQRLIQDLLAFSRVATRGKPFAETDCEQVLEDTLANLRTAMDEAKATVTNDPLPTVIADASQLSQVFQNLVSNALKFHGQAPPAVHIGAQRRGAEWVFSVRDNGIGIDPQYHERIFVIFQTLHPRDQYPGTGIGLALCKRIVERHGGSIWVQSALGEGATFYFTIPDREVDKDE
jgi:PAS domain S-box-containing protein